jgi:hypothetical protein
VHTRHRVRALANALNLSTALGLLVATVGGARVRRGPDGLLLAIGYRLRVPPAPAFTLGNVIMARDANIFERRPALLDHEARHATQYAFCIGLPMVLLYLLASAWSWARCGNPAAYNVFERRAGLADGGYRVLSAGRWWRR